MKNSAVLAYFRHQIGILGRQTFLSSYVKYSDQCSLPVLGDDIDLLQARGIEQNNDGAKRHAQTRNPWRQHAR